MPDNNLGDGKYMMELIADNSILNDTIYDLGKLKNVSIAVAAKTILNEMRDGDNFVVYCIGYRGKRDFEGSTDFPDSQRYTPVKKIFSEVFKSRPIHHYPLSQTDEDKGSYREIATPATEIDIKENVSGLLFDNSIRTGKSMTGAALWALQNSEELGLKRLYTMTLMDCLGMANFSVLRTYKRYGREFTGIRDRLLLNEQIPKDVKEHLDLVSDINPEEKFDFFEHYMNKILDDLMI